MKRSRLIVALALVAALIAGGIVAERNAESSARTLCRQFPLDSDFSEAVRIAMTQGERRLTTVDSITVFYVGLPPFSRHNCEIRGANNKVVATRYFYLD